MRSCIINCILQETVGIISYPCLNLRQNFVSERSPWQHSGYFAACRTCLSKPLLPASLYVGVATCRGGLQSRTADRGVNNWAPWLQKGGENGFPGLQTGGQQWSPPGQGLYSLTRHHLIDIAIINLRRSDVYNGGFYIHKTGSVSVDKGPASSAQWHRTSPGQASSSVHGAVWTRGLRPKRFCETWEETAADFGEISSVITIPGSPGSHSNIRTLFPGLTISIIEIRCSSCRFIFMAGIAKLIRRLYIETVPIFYTFSAIDIAEISIFIQVIFVVMHTTIRYTLTTPVGIVLQRWQFSVASCTVVR